jgi:hypothetical protein
MDGKAKNLLNFNKHIIYIISKPMQGRGLIFKKMTFKKLNIV